MGVTSVEVGSIAPEVVHKAAEGYSAMAVSAKHTVLQLFQIFHSPAQASSSLFRLLNDATSAGERSIAKNAMPITMSRMRAKLLAVFLAAAARLLARSTGNFRSKNSIPAQIGAGIAN